MPFSSHHCSWRALMRVSATTSRDVKVSGIVRAETRSA
jgi:hypothetical protein